MILQKYSYKCGNCGNTFKVAELPGEPYGEFLMRSKSGDVVYLNAIESKEFNEVSSIIKASLNLKRLDQVDRAKILHKIFGIACDLASDNSMYQIINQPICPKCKSNNMASWVSTNPPEFVDEKVKSTTHQNWNKLSYEEKKEVINNILKPIVAIR